MKVYIVAFGKLKTPGIREAVDYYIRNTRSFCQVEEVELKPAHAPDKSAATKTIVRKKEAEILLQKLETILFPKGVFFLLNEKGKGAITLEWANQFRKLEESSIPDVAFVVGGAFGIADSVRLKSKGMFSLGPQTISHEIARLVLAEQIYRAFSVLRGHPYHHEG